MPRGQAANFGDTRVAKNKYHYTKVKDRGWVLTHWLTAEASRGGELIDPETEMVQFKDGFTKADFANPDAVRIIRKHTHSARRRIAVIDDRIRELQAEKCRLEATLTTRG